MTGEVRGACGHDCPDTCSWIVEVRDGTAQTLTGDPAHPFTRGTLCAKVNHYLERVYHPERVLYPLKRVGAKGDAEFARVCWDEALADIAAQMDGRSPRVRRRSDPPAQLGRRPGPDPDGIDRPAAVRTLGAAGWIATSAAPWPRPASKRRSAPAAASIPSRSCTAATSCCGAPTRSSPTCTSGRWCRKRGGAARRSSSSIRSGHGPRRPRTGTCRSSRRATPRWRWR